MVIAAALLVGVGSAVVLSGKDVRGKQADRTTVAIWGSSSAARMAEQGDLSRVLGKPVYNGAVGGEIAVETAARMGAAPALLSVRGDSIPASGQVVVTTTSFGYRPYLRISGTLAGVAGVFRSDGSGGYIFIRSTPGAPVPAAGPLPFASDAAKEVDGSITLLWMGKNDLKQSDWVSADTNTRAAWRYASTHSGRVLVIGHFTDAWMTPGGRARAAFDQLQASYQAEYGDRFVDVQRYLGSDQVWTDLGVTPTAADRTAQARGVLPPSLDDGSHGHLITPAYVAIAEHLIKPDLERLTWI